MLSRDVVEKIILTALEVLNEEQSPHAGFDVGPRTRLFGVDAVLDSLSLVSLIVDVEQAVSDAAGTEISLTDDRAMSQEVSPFSDVEALTSYIMTVPGLA